MIDHEFLQYVAGYAVGALTETETRRLEEHLKEGCDLCEPELRIFQETLLRLPYGLPNKAVPSALKEKVRAKLRREGVFSPSINWNRTVAVAAAASFLILIGSSFWQQKNAVLEREREIAAIQTILQDQREEIAWLRDPSVQLALLTGLAPAPQAKGRMLFSPAASRGIFYADSLPPLGPKKSYQLWVIGGKGPVSAGVFSPDPRGSAVIRISPVERAGGALQFAVTIEPRGGVPQPTGSMVLAGKPL
jgi:anti-sigma-K factor RskA